MSMTTIEGRCGRLDVLQRACTRRLGAVIQLESPEGEQLQTRGRLISCDDRTLYIDRPTSEGVPVELGSPTRAIVHFVFEGERYSFRSVIGEECQIPLGDGLTMPGFAMAFPEHITRDERRYDFRAVLGEQVEVVCQIRAAEAPHGAGFRARLMNLSAGGMSVMAVDLNGEVLQRNRQYVVEFELPRTKGRFVFTTTLQHLHSPSGAGHIAGLKYLPDSDPAEMRQAIRQISQFVAKHLGKRRKR